MIKIIKKNKSKILTTLAILFIYLLGSNLTIPEINHVVFDSIITDNSFFQTMSLLSGGSIHKFSIFSLGVGPYITASITIQLLSMDIIPYLSNEAKKGAKGRIKIEKITRIMSLCLALFQSIILLIIFDKNYQILLNSNLISYLTISIVLTAGSLLLLWLCDKITSKGIGNGISLIIFINFATSIPKTIIDIVRWLIEFDNKTIFINRLCTMTIYISIYILIIILAIILTLAERKIPIQNCNTGNHISFLPLKINSVGVIPVILAQSLLTSPLIIIFFINKKLLPKFNTWLSFENPIILFLYALLIIFFTFLYTNIQFDSNEIAKSLKKSGSYIIGVQPGKNTSKYINLVLNRITILGAFSLTVLALAPYILPNIIKMPINTTEISTGIIIVVGVAIQMIKQLKSSVLNDKYKKYL